MTSIEEKVGYSFKNKTLLETAIKHKSFSFEKNDNNVLHNNERLEFLGDAILDAIVSDYLYKIKPYMKEGEMSKKRSEIVCEKALSNVIKKAGLQSHIILGKCEVKTDGYNKNALLADMFEAIVGAIYLDSDFNTVSKVCMNILNPMISKVLIEDVDMDYKTRLQEILQKDGTIKIEYVLKEESGRPHDKTFFVEVYFNDEKIGEGSGKTKKASEQEAAKEAIKKLEY